MKYYRIFDVGLIRPSCLFVLGVNAPAPANGPTNAPTNGPVSGPTNGPVSSPANGPATREEPLPVG